MGERNLLQIAIIPAYEPSKAFYEYAENLSGAVDRLIVVNDGSGAEYRGIFSRIGTLPNAVVIAYEENRGKGYALKTAFSYCAEHFDPEDIVVTADCDGQHAIRDVLAVCDAAAHHPEDCVLGARDFTQPNVPARSKAGNTQMLRLLRLLYGIHISDSQTGLRACSVRTAKLLTQVSGDRFEYETGTLIYAKRNHIPIREVSIQTIYPEKVEDHVSHFRTFQDSCRVIGTMLRYLPKHSCKKEGSAHFYGKYGRFAKWVFRTFSRRYSWDTTEPEEPVVYVCRHLNMHGPYTTLKTIPFHVHPMIIHVFFDRKTTVQHMTEYTFAARYGKKAKKFSLAAHIMSWIAPPLMRSLQAVPVYRGGAQSVHTLKQGLKVLLHNESLIVYPDIHYMDGYDKPSEIYDGFLYLGDLYLKKTGKALAFVPLFIDEENHRILEGKPICVTNFRKEGSAAAQYLKKAINKEEKQANAV